MTDPSFDPSVSTLDRFRGLLLGGAVGDALGAPVEFMKRAEILAQFGPRGITRFAPAYGRLGAITDDTQMTLFTLEGMIRREVRDHLYSVGSPLGSIGHAYERWYVTQGGRAGTGEKIDGWLVEQQELWSRRAPGATCLSAMSTKLHWGDPAENDSKGAGGIMRVGPIGLVANKAYQLGEHAAALTHGHITGQVAAGWFAAWVQAVAHGQCFEAAARTAWVRPQGKAPELDAALKQAFRLSQGGPRDCVPAVLGEGWIAEEAAAIALWCVLTAAEPMEALRLAVNIDGDSDTTGTLVGQILGAAYGPGWIPAEMLEQLELREVIEKLAADAVNLFWGELTADAAWRWYPGW